MGQRLQKQRDLVGVGAEGAGNEDDDDDDFHIIYNDPLTTR